MTENQRYFDSFVLPEGLDFPGSKPMPDRFKISFVNSRIAVDKNCRCVYGSNKMLTGSTPSGSIILLYA